MHPTAANSEKVAKKVSRGLLSSFSRLAVVLYIWLTFRLACNTCRLKRKKVCNFLIFRCPVCWLRGPSAMVLTRVPSALITNLSVFIPRSPAEEVLRLVICATQKLVLPFSRSLSDSTCQNYPRKMAKISSIPFLKLPRLCSQRPGSVPRMFGMHTRLAGPRTVGPRKWSSSS